MRRPLALALAAVTAVLGGACSTSPCQTLGEKLCHCTGVASSDCTTQVENQLKPKGPVSQDVIDHCQLLLDRCNQPRGADFCEWLLTEPGQIACGLAPDPASAPSTAR